jgi:hypothetical protein
MKEESERKFVASVYRIWMMRYVDVPEATARWLTTQSARRGKKRKASKYIPVVATVNGRSERTTLLPAGGGRYRMQFNAALRKAANADAGDVVSIAISLDREPREFSVPPDLLAALREHPKAKKAFENVPPGYRRQILKWMDGAKGDAARKRRIEVMIDRMLERAILGPTHRRRRRARSE